MIVSSVSFANNVIQSVGKVTFPGFTGVFNVTPNAIMLAHDAPVVTVAVDAGTAGPDAGMAAADGGDRPAGPAGRRDGHQAEQPDGAPLPRHLRSGRTDRAAWVAHRRWAGAGVGG